MFGTQKQENHLKLIGMSCQKVKISYHNDCHLSIKCDDFFAVIKKLPCGGKTRYKEEIKEIIKPETQTHRVVVELSYSKNNYLSVYDLNLFIVPLRIVHFLAALMESNKNETILSIANNKKNICFGVDGGIFLKDNKDEKDQNR
jgi:hypothetical protein